MVSEAENSESWPLQLTRAKEDVDALMATIYKLVKQNVPALLADTPQVSFSTNIRHWSWELMRFFSSHDQLAAHGRTLTSTHMKIESIFKPHVMAHEKNHKREK